MTITLNQETILGYVLPAIGLVMTIVRLIIRKRSGRLGLDDYTIAIASVAQINLMIATNLYLDAKIPTGPRKVGFFYWTGSSYYTIIWPARLSILLSIRRMIPSGNTVRFCTMAAVGFCVFWCALMIQFFVTCEHKKGWKQLEPLPQCPLGDSVAFTQLGLDTVADLVIIVVPAIFFWKSRLPLPKRIGLISVFAVSVVTSIVGFSHVYYILHGPPLVENLNGILQSSISVIACNLPIIVFKTISLTSKDHTNIDEEATMNEQAWEEKSRGVTSTIAPPLPTLHKGDSKDGGSDLDEKALP